MSGIISLWVKKPVVISAIRFNGENFVECKNFIGIKNIDNTLNYPNIITSEGVMRVNVGDYIIKEPFDKGRGFYPCKPDIFELTYDAKDDFTIKSGYGATCV